MTKIYGVDNTQPFTTIDVRDAIIECFVQAHNEILDKDLKDFSQMMSQESYEGLKTMNIKKMIHGVFDELGEDFNNPSKEALIKVCDKLAEFSRQFRSPEIIKKHYNEIMGLVNKLA